MLRDQRQARNPYSIRKMSSVIFHNLLLNDLCITVLRPNLRELIQLFKKIRHVNMNESKPQTVY